MSSWIKNINLEGDKTIWGVVLVLSLFSVVVVYSTAGWHSLFNHITKLLLGLFAIFRFLEISPILGLVVGLSICASMLIAATIGSLVPLILDRFDIDPAVATGPFVTTAIDILGVALYFWIAGALFNLA